MITYNADVIVLLTVFNRPSVVNTINSVLNQTFKNFQLLIVDNASDDGTYELLQSFAEKDKRVNVVRNDINRGQTYSLHRGMSLAEGKYIARIDADDLMVETRLEKQYRFLESNADYGFCGSWVQLITDDNRKGYIVRTCTTDKGLRTMQYLGCGAYHPSVMMRKSTLDKNGISYNINYKMAEDYDMWRQILSYSKGLNIDEVLTYYRRGENNDSTQHKAVTNQEARTIRAQIISENADSLNVSNLKKIFETETDNRKSILKTLKAYIAYKKFLRDSISKDSIDYSIISERMKFLILGNYIKNNNALWSKCILGLYNTARSLRYAMYR